MTYLAESESSSTEVAAGPAVPGANVPNPGANPDPKVGTPSFGGAVQWDLSFLNTMLK